MGNVNQNEEAKIFAENLSYYMKLHKVDRVMLANELGFKYTTVCDWCNGKVVPRKNKIKVLADYFSISENALTWRDNLLTDKNINKKREILVYKDFPTKLSFDKENESNYLWEEIELPTLYGDPDNYFGYIIFDEINNYGKKVFPEDTIVFKKSDRITKKNTFYVIKTNKGKPVIAYLTESDNSYIFMPIIEYSKIKPIVCSKDDLNVRIIGVSKYLTRNL